MSTVLGRAGLKSTDFAWQYAPRGVEMCILVKIQHVHYLPFSNGFVNMKFQPFKMQGMGLKKLVFAINMRRHEWLLT